MIMMAIKITNVCRSLILCWLHVLAFWSFTITLWGKYYYPHFEGKETEALGEKWSVQSSIVTKSQWQSQDLNSGSLVPESSLLILMSYLPSEFHRSTWRQTNIQHNEKWFVFLQADLERVNWKPFPIID